MPRCENCGTENIPGSLYCKRCGKPISRFKERLRQRARQRFEEYQKRRTEEKKVYREEVAKRKRQQLKKRARDSGFSIAEPSALVWGSIDPLGSGIFGSSKKKKKKGDDYDLFF